MGELLLEDVTVRHDGLTAVDGVDLRVAEGELLVLVGPSGCGKTTLLRTVAGLESPDDGEVAIDGRRVTDLPPRERDVSLVFQDFALFPHLSARENVAFDLRMQGADRVEERVQEAADLLDVGDLLDRPIDELSGGQKQRVALGRAMVTEPAAFLLDEPLANLDAGLRERMRSEIQRLHRHLGAPTVHVTHDQAEALAMGDRVAVMLDGEVAQVGAPEDVYWRPDSLTVARFVGSPEMNLLDGTYDADAGGVVVDRTGADELVVPVRPAETDRSSATSDRPASSGRSADDDRSADGERVTVGVRPERVDVRPERDDVRPERDDVRPERDDVRPERDDVRPERDGVTGSSREEPLFEATVRADEFNGADRFLRLDGPGDVGLVARVPAETSVDVGERVGVAFDRDRVHCFDAATGERLPVEDPSGSDGAGGRAGADGADAGDERAVVGRTDRTTDAERDAAADERRDAATDVERDDGTAAERGDGTDDDAVPPASGDRS